MQAHVKENDGVKWENSELKLALFATLAQPQKS